MYKTKRDVDNHWSEINRRIPSETERNLKVTTHTIIISWKMDGSLLSCPFFPLQAWTVAKLYFKIGEHDLAIKFLDKYDSARKNAPQVQTWPMILFDKTSFRIYPFISVFSTPRTCLRSSGCKGIGRRNN